MIIGLFALSLDLILGYAGVVSLGHAAFFGLGGYTAGILASQGFGDPTLGSSWRRRRRGRRLRHRALVLRGSDLTRLMVTLGVSLMLGELANRNGWLTGGADGLNFSMGPVLGLFPIDFTGQRNAALYSFVVLFVLFALARRIVQSPFGLSLRGDPREPAARRRARHDTAGASLRSIRSRRPTPASPARCSPQTTQIVSLDLFDFHRSADVLLMLIIGGAGYLYGGLIGAAVFIVLRDVLSAATPEYWEFWIGLAARRARARRPRADRRSAPAARSPSCAPRRAGARRERAGAGDARPRAPFRRTDRHRRCFVRDRARRAPGADRPQRRRQDDAGQSADGRAQADRGRGPAGGAMSPAAASARVGAASSRTFQINQLFPDLTPAESLCLAIAERNGSGADFWRVAGGRPAIVAEIEDAARRVSASTADGPADPHAALRQATPARDRARARLPPARAAARRAGGRRAGGASAPTSSPRWPPCRPTSPILLIEHDMDLVFSFASAFPCWWRDAF